MKDPAFVVDAPGVDARELQARLEARLAEKRGRVFTDAEVQEIADRPLPGVLDPADATSGLLAELQEHPELWNYAFAPDALTRSSRGAMGRLLESLRSLLKPIQKLFWNPNPMIAALSRQSDLNQAAVHVLHNLVLEVTRLRLEVQSLQGRVLQLQGRLELLDRREKTLEALAVLKDDTPAT